MTDGIHIPADVAADEGIPEELDANVVGVYDIPDPRRRRTAAAVYLATAVVLLVSGGTSVWVGVVLALVLAVYHSAAVWPLALDERQALAVAAPLIPFPVGHASAAVTFHGLRSRPRWHVVVYSPEEPPSRRALVVLDGVTGEVRGDVYVEDVPET